MPTSVRLDERTESAVRRLARRRGQTKSEVIRDAIQALATAEDRAGAAESPYDRMKHAIGSVSGLPRDLSERTGDKVHALLLKRLRHR